MRITLGITGSIAAYRSPDFVKALVERGDEVQVILTQSGSQFVTARTLETFSGKPVLANDTFHATHLGTDHIRVARWSELIVIYGATADFIARYAHGLADGFLHVQLLAAECPVILAPAMNPSMWNHPAVQENLTILKKRGVILVSPISGKVACGESGIGHIADHASILDAFRSKIPTKCAPLTGKKILISAGPMRTELDPVRYLQNRSSGKMGLALAKCAREMGAEVKLLLGPVEESMRQEFSEFTAENYRGPAEYQRALDKLLPNADIFLSLAAVLDFELVSENRKIERESLRQHASLALPLKMVPDFVAGAARKKMAHQKIVAFAAESGSEQEIIERARRKMLKKGVDAIVANPVRGGLGPESDRNELWVLKPDGSSVHFSPALKSDLARPLLTELFLKG